MFTHFGARSRASERKRFAWYKLMRSIQINVKYILSFISLILLNLFILLAFYFLFLFVSPISVSHCRPKLIGQNISPNEKRKLPEFFWIFDFHRKTSIWTISFKMDILSELMFYFFPYFLLSPLISIRNGISKIFSSRLLLYFS